MTAPITALVHLVDDDDAVRDAVRCHFNDADRPKVIRLHFVWEEVIAA